jgi:hypothetical protein
VLDPAAGAYPAEIGFSGQIPAAWDSLMASAHSRSPCTPAMIEWRQGASLTRHPQRAKQMGGLPGGQSEIVEVEIAAQLGGDTLEQVGDHDASSASRTIASMRVRVLAISSITRSASQPNKGKPIMTSASINIIAAVSVLLLSGRAPLVSVADLLRVLAGRARSVIALSRMSTVTSSTNRTR